MLESAVARPRQSKRQLQQPMVLETRDDDGGDDGDGANSAVDTGTRHLSTSRSFVMTTENGTTTVQNEALTLLALLPDDLANELKDVTDRLTDIVLDLGCQPFAWEAGKRQRLGGHHNRVVTSTDIGSIVHSLGSTSSAFGRDNRAGLEQQLHRISAVRNRQGDVIGLTLRVGRHITGCATMIADLLFESPTDESILFLGAPGSGTRFLKNASRLLFPYRF
jgi:hypothetical protein